MSRVKVEILKNSDDKFRYINRLVDGADGNTVGVSFYGKSDNILRNRSFRKGVRKDIKGVGLGYEPDKVHNVVLWDMNANTPNRETKGGYRTFNTDKTVSVRRDKKQYQFVDKPDGSTEVIITANN